MRSVVLLLTVKGYWQHSRRSVMFPVSKHSTRVNVRSQLLRKKSKMPPGKVIVHSFERTKIARTVNRCAGNLLKRRYYILLFIDCVRRHGRRCKPFCSGQNRLRYHHGIRDSLLHPCLFGSSERIFLCAHH